MKKIERHSGRGELFIVSAPSGAGKTTICRKLMKIVPRLKHSVSYTTRAPREGEVNNVHYTFISEKKFKSMIARGEFAEWAVVHGNLYGTSVKRLKELNSKGYDIILDVDTQGAAQMRRVFREAVFIFILPPSMRILEKRLRSRMSESEAEVKIRLERAMGEILNYKNYDYIIINDDLKKAVKEMVSIITAGRLRTSRVNSPIIKNINSKGG
ncbi:MAG: guanylate kinase [Nitrospirae bacterium]|nr:guanylate kinase [Nitrospirota bacterium]